MGCNLIVNKKIPNKNYKGLGMTEKEKKQEETQTGLIILFLYPLTLKYQGIRNSIIAPSVSPRFFSFSVIPNPL